ncbi:bifunctional aconitate hydratase 2/2-methylisocitrate dehydratase [Bisgaard Taxon 10/6]|uniref:bifunctional aconitate hydratase 2/2-methylisocitrate dehydratase n=1 Tax=Exercitatus varius TaxID=67857 RepID=UPI00294AD5ED|nr:bifunctional aconitate hydratase 2/2-methylisocitrate dehydratase [Exercitatus varius]MDG2956458.1 bifunctional aconitate hydratase 2/2-methylisocitrate dehydratase [Exercitatus varius]MDG2963066.1 bifunctional aconitate hydratase 2/2-methylisocitrate dehydratase [Exercitatus varius]MDG2964785.1 bifunctional aconitate hydratase 2/2-methylisocitrate dehydratase [Exercitatus varius]
MSNFLAQYQSHVDERAALGIVPKPLDAEQTRQLIELLKNPVTGKENELLSLFENRVPAGVDDAAKVKAEFLAKIVNGQESSPLISAEHAVELLGTMSGGYNVQPLIDLLDNDRLAPLAAKALSFTLLIFDNFNAVAEKAQKGNVFAKQVLQSWADAEWFTSRPKLADKVTLTVFKVLGETNTDDLSPAQEAWCRSDIPLHANAMLKMPREGIEPDQPGAVGPLKQLAALKSKGFPLVYVGDVVGTGSSRKSATNSVLWHMGDDIPFIPNKRTGGFVFGGKIAPIFFNTAEDSGALPVELDVTALNMGDIIDVYPYERKICKHDSQDVLTTFNYKTEGLLDEVRAGGRIPLIIGRSLTAKARAELGLPESDAFVKAPVMPDTGKGFTLAQKMVGKACGVKGVRAGQYCEPFMASVGSQDTTGTMTRDELKDLACLKFSSPLVMQSFCHTAPYPKPSDVVTHKTLPEFITSRGGVALRPGDGVIHSWLNRMLLPFTVGTGGDSHTRFPIGISFPAGSGLVAFAAATGMMPLDMPESVLVRFTGTLQKGITLRDLVHAIPYFAIRQGLLTVEKENKKNVFSGRILEIEGLETLTAEQAFELADATAERSAAACTVKLNENAIAEYLRSNIVLLKTMIADGYSDAKTLENRVKAMEEWLANPEMLEADADAEYAAVLEINMDEIKEPILCVPNDPDDARLLSEVQGNKIDEVFIGSCMTNIGHFRAAGKLLGKLNGELNTRLWLAPPTKMDAEKLSEEGYYNIYGRTGARTEMPGCSLCMGNQARVRPNSSVVSTSTRNFPNRLGQGAQVYLASAELAAVAAILGRLPTVEEYFNAVADLDGQKDEVYRYLNFDRLPSYMEKAERVIFQASA